MDSVGSRVQNLPLPDQVLILARLVQDRSEEGYFSPIGVESLFDEIGLPPPPKVANVLRSLKGGGLVTSLKRRRGAWKLTPSGLIKLASLAPEMDLAALAVEAAQPRQTLLGDTAHPVIPPSLAPPALVGPLRAFLAEFPFEQNIFGMTRFPGPKGIDPLLPAIERARELCREKGLVFHLASDRSIVDDLWANVAAHMWGCRFGIAFFEARSETGLNYNLNIEVGSCLVLGRRMALLKDHSLEQMPTDLVGQIYLDVDLDKPESVSVALSGWLHETLRAKK
jgi:hypothetical protein